MKSGTQGQAALPRRTERSEAGRGMLTTVDPRADRAAHVAFGKGSGMLEQRPWLQRRSVTRSQEQRRLSPSGHSAPCVQEGSAHLGRRSGAILRLRLPVRVCQHLSPNPPQPLATVPKEGGGEHLLVRVPSGYCLGHRHSRVLGFSAITRAPRDQGVAAAHLVLVGTPGQGVVPASGPLIPALESRAPRAGRMAKVSLAGSRNRCFPQPSPARPLATARRSVRGVAERGLASRQREGVWPDGFSLKWLQVWGQLEPAEEHAVAVVEWLFGWD